jgi:hypothetical protein
MNRFAATVFLGLIPEDYHGKKQEIRQWLKEHDLWDDYDLDQPMQAKGGFQQTYYFTDANSAMMFKLRFGGAL